MSGVDRDIQCGHSFLKLYELGCFAEEFIVYGCSYLEKGKVYYIISSNPEKICQVVADSVIENRSCSPIMKKAYQQKVASGTKEDIKQKIMLDMATEISKIYGKEYFESERTWLERSPNSSAKLLLELKKHELTGCFDKPQLMLFEGLCREALRLKVLERHIYDEFDRWLKHVYRQMEDDVIEKNKFNRELSGFAYEKNNQIKYFFDANKINTVEKREQFIHGKIFVTPILTKEYNFSELNQLADIRKDFKVYLEQMLNDQYILTVKKIYELAYMK